MIEDVPDPQTGCGERAVDAADDGGRLQGRPAEGEEVVVGDDIRVWGAENVGDDAGDEFGGVGGVGSTVLPAPAMSPVMSPVMSFRRRIR